MHSHNSLETVFTQVCRGHNT